MALLKSLRNPYISINPDTKELYFTGRLATHKLVYPFAIGEKVITDSVLPTVIGAAISGAIDQFDIQALQASVAEQMARSIASGVQLMFRETTIDMLLMLRKVPDYDKERREKERAKIIAEMDGKL